jgi:hypothetical protein
VHQAADDDGVTAAVPTETAPSPEQSRARRHSQTLRQRISTFV